MKKISPQQIRKNLLDADSYIASEEFNKAEKLLREVIELFPSQPEALLKLAIIFFNQNRFDDGFKLINKSLLVNPKQPEALFNYTVALYNSSDFLKAIQVSEEFIKINNTNSDIYFIRGLIFKSIDNLDKSLENYYLSIKYNPNNSHAYLNASSILIEKNAFQDAINLLTQAKNYIIFSSQLFFNLGLALQKIYNYLDANSCYSQAIQLEPNYVEAINNRGLTFLKREQYIEALNDFDSALIIKKDYVDYINNKSIALLKLGRVNDALLQASYAEILNPKSIYAHINKANAFIQLFKFDKALLCLEIAKKLDSNNAEIYISLAFLYEQKKEFIPAIENYKLALSLDPNLHQASFNLSVLFLSQLNFNEGWDLYESREKRREYIYKSSPQKIYLDKFPQDGESVLIHHEQGIGDQILFLNMLYDLSILNHNFIISVDPRLLPIFERSFPKFKFISNQIKIDESSFKYHILMGSLGKIFRGDLICFEPKNTYLLSNAIKTNSLKSLINKKSKFLCGLSWKSSNQKIGNLKSISLENLLPLLKLPNFEFINLQYGETRDEVNSIATKFNINIKDIDSIDKFNDLDTLFSLVDSCDLIITSSNVTAHIAGALRKNTYVLTPFAHGKIWYWHEYNGKNLWYPTVKIINQSSFSDWDSSVAQLASIIEKEYT